MLVTFACKEGGRCIWITVTGGTTQPMGTILNLTKPFLTIFIKYSGHLSITLHGRTTLSMKCMLNLTMPLLSIFTKYSPTWCVILLFFFKYIPIIQLFNRFPALPWPNPDPWQVRPFPPLLWFRPSQVLWRMPCCLRGQQPTCACQNRKSC